jgi:WD40 repeat protein
MKRVGGCWLLSILYVSVPAQTPNLVLPVGHTSSVSTVACSPDGKFVVTASWDNTAKIWSAPEGRLMYDLKAHSASLLFATYSHSGKYIVTTSKDSTAIIWNATSGTALYQLHGHNDWVNAASFTPDDKYLLTSSWDNTVKIWSVATGKLLNTLTLHRGSVNNISLSQQGDYFVTSSKDSTAAIVKFSTRKTVAVLYGHKDWVNNACFSNDGKFVATASKDGTCRIWLAANGKLLRTLTGHRASVNTVSFNASSTQLLTASNDNTCRAWDVTTGKLIYQLEGHEAPVVSASYSDNGKYIVTASADNTARLWSAANGKILSELKGHTGALNAAVFSPGARYVATASMDNSAVIWSVANGETVVRLIGHTSVVTSASYSKDGKYLVTASWDNTAKIWNARDGRLLSELRGHTDWINTAGFSPDGRFVVTASSDNSAMVWSVPDGKLLRQLKGHTDWVGSAIFSDDGKYIVTTSWDNTSKIFLAETGEQITELKGHSNYIKWINFSHDERYIVTASADNTARIWSVPDGKMLHQLAGHSDKVRTAEFTNDDRYLITAAWDSTARIWDVRSGETVHELRGHTGSLNSAIVSPDGKHVATTSMDHTARIWNIEDGSLEYVLRQHTGSITSAHYSRDGKLLALGSWDNTASVWDAGTGRLLHVLAGHSAAIKSAAFSPDAKFIITTSEDNTLKKWNAATGDFLFTFFAVDSTDYLAIDNDGHYDGTENARKMLYYVCGGEIIDLEQFKDLSWEPGLISKLSGINNEPITAKKISEINICNYTPLVQEKGTANGNYNYFITPRLGGIGEIQLYVNGKLIETYDPSSLLRQNNSYLLQVNENSVRDYFISGANNLLIVKATTKEGLMVSRGAYQLANGIRKPSVHPDMYIIAIGISNYKGDKLELKYASKDAVDFASAVTASAKKLLNADGGRHVFSYGVNTEQGSTRWPAKEKIQQLIDTIAMKAKSDDILLIFFAGHGILQMGQKNFYLLTADASTADINGVEKDVAISTDELKEWLRKIKANKQLLILDACNSGQVVQQLQAIVGRREIPADQQRALESLKDKTGTFILAASASGQSAYETSLYGQGLLTYSLLSGIKFGTGLKDNKFIDVTRWFNYACDNVKLMASQIGGRQDPQIVGTASFEIGLVDKDVVDNIHLASRKKLFKSSRFIQDEDLLNDDLDLSYLVNRELNNLSAAGKESPLVFASETPSAEAFSVRGRYELKENKVAIKVSLFKGQRERLYQFDLSSTTDKKEDLARKIVDNIKNYLSKTGNKGL